MRPHVLIGRAGRSFSSLRGGRHMQGLGVLGITHGPVGECLRCFPQPALLVKQRGERVVRLWEGRCASGRPSQLCNGPLEVTLALQTDAHVVPAIRQFGSDLRGAPVGTLCLRRPASLHVHAPERDPAAAVARCVLERASQVLNPFFPGAGVIAEEPQAVERLRVVRIPAQHAAVAHLRFGQATRVVGNEGTAEGIVGNGHAVFGYRSARSRGVRAGVNHGGPFRPGQRPRFQLAPALRGVGRRLRGRGQDPAGSQRRVLPGRR